MLQAYRKAKSNPACEYSVSEITEKLTQLPNDPFSRELIELFNFHYLVVSESIDAVIDKALILREQKEGCQRFVTVKQKYYNYRFLPRQTHLKYLRVFNHEGKECYRVKTKIRVNITKLLKWIGRSNKYKFSDIFTFRQKSQSFLPLEICRYSQYVNLSDTNRSDYYDFFCDYYGKVQLVSYLDKKHTATPTTENKIVQPPLLLVQDLTTAQQVLWGFFFFKLMGLRIRVNADATTLTRFLHILNNLKIEGYKKSYYYTLAKKVHLFSENKNLLKDLEIVRLNFMRNKLPVDDIEKEIFTLVSN